MKCLAVLVVVVLMWVSVEGASSSKRNKYGRCPQLIDFVLGAKCENPCKSDGDCSGEDKCCLNDCGGNECLQPLKEVPDKMCKIACTREYDPVCGTDGITYGTWCMLNFTSCTRNQRWIKMDYKGVCKEQIEQCQIIPGQTGPCEGKLLEYREQALIGAMRPQCDEEGFYSPKQCLASTGSCWCVDCMGNEISSADEGDVTDESCLELREN